MINTKLYKSVYVLAEKLLEADEKNNKSEFDTLYAQLRAVCLDNENNDKDHPEQWETLADFTEDLDKALDIYDKAMVKAKAIESKDHMASIAFSMAELQHELGQTDKSIESLEFAKTNAKTLDDKKFQAEIDNMLKDLKK